MNHPARRLPYLLIAAAMLFVHPAVQAQSTDVAEGHQLAVLASDAPAAAKCNACRALQIVGSEQSVGALAELLTDPEVSHAARVALEVMPYPSVDAALLAALESTEGRTRIGIVTTLGNRRHDAAVPPLAALLRDATQGEDSATRDAVLMALAKIATPAAQEAIVENASGAAQDARTKFDQALLLVAQARLARGELPEATELMARLAGPEVDPVVRSAAIAGKLQLVRGGEAEAHVAALRSEDPLVWQAAATQLAGLPDETIRAVAQQLPQLPPPSQLAVLSAIAIRRTAQVTPQVVEAARSEDPQVQLAALRALGRVGDRTALGLLMEVAQSEGPRREAARDSLTRLHAPGVDDDLRERLLAEQDPQRRGDWIALVVARNTPGVAEVLLGEVTHASPAVRRPAMAALIHLAEREHLPAMTRAVLVATPGEERDEAEKAVMLLAQRADDPAERTAAVLEVYRQASRDEQLALLPLLGRIGGDTAKETILAALHADEASEAQQDAAVRALSNWPDASVADELRELAQHADTPRHRIWSLRALIRVVSLPDAMPDNQKLAELTRAMELAERDDERRLALKRMASVRTIESLRLLVPYLDRPELNQTAAMSITELARHQHLRNPHTAEFLPALERVIEITNDAGTLERAKRYLQAAQE